MGNVGVGSPAALGGPGSQGAGLCGWPRAPRSSAALQPASPGFTHGAGAAAGSRPAPVAGGRRRAGRGHCRLVGDDRLSGCPRGPGRQCWPMRQPASGGSSEAGGVGEGGVGLAQEGRVVGGRVRLAQLPASSGQRLAPAAAAAGSKPISLLPPRRCPHRHELAEQGKRHRDGGRGLTRCRRPVFWGRGQLLLLLGAGALDNLGQGGAEGWRGVGRGGEGWGLAAEQGLTPWGRGVGRSGTGCLSKSCFSTTHCWLRQHAAAPTFP